MNDENKNKNENEEAAWIATNDFKNMISEAILIFIDWDSSKSDFSSLTHELNFITNFMPQTIDIAESLTHKTLSASSSDYAKICTIIGHGLIAKQLGRLIEKQYHKAKESQSNEEEDVCVCLTSILAAILPLEYDDLFDYVKKTIASGKIKLSQGIDLDKLNRN